VFFVTSLGTLRIPSFNFCSISNFPHIFIEKNLAWRLR
jgi:hypothetical protein